MFDGVIVSVVVNIGIENGVGVTFSSILFAIDVLNGFSDSKAFGFLVSTKFDNLD